MVVLAAQHVADLHQRIVDGVTEEKRRRAVAAPDNEITDVVAVEALRPAHQIVECHLPAGRHTETQRRPAALGQFLCHLLRREVRAGARIARRPPGRLQGLARQLQLGIAAETGIGRTGFFERPVILCVDVLPLRLEIGSLLATGVGTFPPVQSQPPKLPHERLRVLAAAAPGVGILDTQQEHAPLPGRVEIVEQRGTQVAQVNVPGGTGRKPGFYNGFTHRCHCRPQRRAC